MDHEIYHFISLINLILSVWFSGSFNFHEIINKPYIICRILDNPLSNFNMSEKSYPGMFKSKVVINWKLFDLILNFMTDSVSGWSPSVLSFAQAYSPGLLNEVYFLFTIPVDLSFLNEFFFRKASTMKNLPFLFIHILLKHRMTSLNLKKNHLSRAWLG